MTKADAKHIELLRAAGPQARSRLAFAVTDEVFALSRRALERAWPDLDATERTVKFVEIVYGSKLATRIAERLRHR